MPSQSIEAGRPDPNQRNETYGIKLATQNTLKKLENTPVVADVKGDQSSTSKEMRRGDPVDAAGPYCCPAPMDGVSFLTSGLCAAIFVSLDLGAFDLKYPASHCKKWLCDLPAFSYPRMPSGYFPDQVADGGNGLLFTP